MSKNEILSTYQKYYNIRANRGMSDTEVSNSVKVSRNTLVNWKNGRTMPSVKTLYKIANFFGVAVTDIIGIS